MLYVGRWSRVPRRRALPWLLRGNIGFPGTDSVHLELLPAAAHRSVELRNVVHFAALLTESHEPPCRLYDVFVDARLAQLTAPVVLLQVTNVDPAVVSQAATAAGIGSVRAAA